MNMIDGFLKKTIKQFLQHARTERGFSPATVAAYEYDLTKFREFLATSLKDGPTLSKDNVRDYLVYLTDERKNAPVTRSRKLATLKSYFGFLKREKLIGNDPTEGISLPKIPKIEPTFLTEAECKKLIETVRKTATPFYKKRDLAIIMVFLGSGIRVGELAGLKIGDLDLLEMRLKVYRKGAREQLIPLSPDVCRSLEAYLRWRADFDGQHLFISRLNSPMKRNTVYYLVRKYLKEAEIKKDKQGAHILRHSCFTALLNNGVNIVVIQELAGHQNLNTTRRYVHLRDSDLRDAVNSLDLSLK